MKPIIMSTEDVRGILDGRKTMVRMPIKPHPKCFYDISQEEPFRPGDVLWVRETWKPQDYSFVDNVMSCQIIFKAGGPDNLNPRVFWNHGDDTVFESCGTWHPSIHMPREAARLFLRVKDIRVERVQDIRFTDALSEGVKPDFTEHEGRLEHPVIALANAISAQNSALVAFKKHWNARNAKRGYGWDGNPWVWVIEFERTQSGAIGPETDGTAPNGDKGAGE